MPVPDLARAYADHAVGIFAFARTLTGCESEAREVLQEVFVKFARHDKTDSIRDLRAYLLRIAHRVVIDRGRSERARRRAAARMAGETPNWFARADDPDTTAFREALTLALGVLPAEQGTVVHLKLWEGRTFEEIADLLDLPLNTAASRYRYGIDKLRIALRPLYEEIRHLPQP